jgi:hypothetical protein
MVIEVSTATPIRTLRVAREGADWNCVSFSAANRLIAAWVASIANAVSG